MTGKSISHVIAHYACSNLVRQLMGVLTVFLRSRLLAPEHFGLWSLLNLIPQYSGFLHLGSRSSLTFRIPVLNRQQDGAGAARLRGTVRLASLGPNLVVAAGIALWGAFLTDDSELAVLLYLSAVLVMVNWWFEHLLALLKAEQAFHIVGHSNYLRAALMLLATLVLLPLWGVAGAVSALALALFLTGIYLHRHARALAHGGFHLPALRELVRQGFPLLGVSLVLLLMRNADRMMIAGMLDLHAVGLYALGGMIVGFLINVPGVSREVLEPRLMQEMQDRPLEELVTPYLLEPMYKSALLMPVVLVPLILLLPSVLLLLLPAYVDGVEAIRVLILSSFVMALFYPLRGVVVAMHWQGRTLVHAGLALVFNVAGNYFVLQAGMGLTAVAWVSVAAFVVLLLLEWGTVMGRLASLHLLLPGRRTLSWLLALAVGLAGTLLAHRALTGMAADAHLVAVLVTLSFLAVYLPVVRLLYHPPSSGEALT